MPDTDSVVISDDLNHRVGILFHNELSYKLFNITETCNNIISVGY